MKRKYWMYVLLVIPFLWMACDDDEDNDNNLEPGFSKTDKNFIERAARTNMFEIELSQLAVAQGRDSITKVFAQSLVDEHSMAQTELKAIADSHASVQWPEGLSDLNQQVKDSLASLTGYPFDINYIEAVQRIHLETIPSFESAAGGSTNEATKAWAQKYWPIMEEHLAIADSVAIQIEANWANESDTTDNSSGRRNP